MEVSLGKRSLILDMKTDPGRDIFDRLVETADVVVHNFRPGVAERLGIDYERIHRINRKLVYLNITALDGPKPGHWMNRPGFDPIVQAAVGDTVVKAILPSYTAGHPVSTISPATPARSGSFLLFSGRSEADRPVLSFGRPSLQGGKLEQAPFMFSADGDSTGEEPQE